MAEKYYLDKVGLQDVAGHVNTRLKTVTTIPVSADDGAVRLYVGETGATYKKGHIYQYNATDLEWVDITGSTEYTAGNGIDIDDGEISVETYIFTGTQAQWDALTTEQKQEYQICNITDDGSADEAIYTKAEIDAMLGTAASKDYTDTVRPNDHDLVESNAVYAAINNAVSSIYTPRGDLTCAELTSALLIEVNVGNVYQMSDSGTTSALFINGAGKTINVNDNVGIIKAGANTYMFNLMGNAFDLHDYQKQDLSTPITIGGTSRTTVESALGALESAKQDKTLETPLTIGGASQTTVEDALSALNDVDATKMSYADNGILGAKNLYQLLKSDVRPNLAGSTFTLVDGELTINCTETDFSGAYIRGASIQPKFDYLANVPCILSFKYKSSVVCDGQIGMDYSKISMPTEWTEYSTIVADPSSIRDIVFYTREASTSPIIYVKDIMLRLATDTNDIYQPHSMTNQQLTPYVQAISNPNLIDNPWFTINQRGGSSYTSDWVYTVDRWLKGESYTLSVGNNGISASVINIDHGHLSQRLDIYNNLVGKTCTLSILKSTGEILSATGVVLSGIGISMAISDNDIWCALVKDANFDFIALNFKNTTTTVRAVKLELGSVSTLAMDIAPNYVNELQKCMRYFYRMTIDATNAQIGLVRCANATTAQYYLNFPVAMRTSPNITTKNETHMYIYDSTTHVVSAISKFSEIKDSNDIVGIALNITTTGLTQNNIGLFAGGNDLSSYPFSIDFSADL